LTPDVDAPSSVRQALGGLIDPMTSIQTPTAIHTLTSGTHHESIEVGLPHDFYRLIHKGIRYTMFHTAMQAGSADVGDDEQVSEVLARCTDLVGILKLHHHHEDLFVKPLLESVAPDLSSLVEAQHVVVDEGIEQLTALGRRLAGASALARSNVAHRLYLDLTRFTAVYLDHQLYEETVVMPALCAAVPVDDLETVHTTQLRLMPLDVLLDGARVMLPAINIGERADMLAGLSSAPADVFAAVRRAAASVLTPAQFAQVADRIGMH
jgi:hypothetical protein